MDREVQRRKVSPRLAFGLALAAAAVPGLWVFGPLALYLSVGVEGRGGAARALSYLACAELIAAAVVLAISALS